MAASMLGMSPEEIEGQEEIVDLLGELGNIIGGSLKSALTDAGLACALSTPSFTTGTDFEIELLNLEQYERLAFEHDGHTVFVEMGIKISDLAKAADPSADEDPGEVSENEPAPAANEVFAGTEAPASPPPAEAMADSPPAPPEESEAETSPAAGEDFNLELLLDIPLEITVELGRTRIHIRELLDIEPGSAVKLSRLEGEPVDILANDTLIAKGEVVVQNEKYGIRITEITSRMDRIRNLR
jgi:flagellar motor switch protein FliN